MKNKFLICAALAASVVLASCARNDEVSWPRQSSVTIKGKTRPIERLLYQITDVVYPPDEAREDIVALRVTVEGAGVSVDLPLRLLGEKIDLSARDTSPRPGDLYYTFYLSERSGGEGEYGDWLYCAIRSWDTTSDRRSAYGGRFSIDRGDEPGEWIFEWELTDDIDGKVVSTGYIDSIFDPIS
jgi:hypothetical protein